MTTFCKWSRLSSRGQFLSKGVVADDLPALLQARSRRDFVTIFLQILRMVLLGQHRANKLVMNQTYQRDLMIIYCLKLLGLKLFQYIQIMRWFLCEFWPAFGIKLKIPNVCPIAQNQYSDILVVPQSYPSRQGLCWALASARVISRRQPRANHRSH